MQGVAFILYSVIYLVVIVYLGHYFSITNQQYLTRKYKFIISISMEFNPKDLHVSG